MKKNYKLFDEKNTILPLFYILIILYLVFLFLFVENKNSGIRFIENKLSFSKNDWYYYDVHGNKKFLNGYNFKIDIKTDKFVLYKDFPNDYPYNSDYNAVMGIFRKNRITAKVDGEVIYEMNADALNRQKNTIILESIDIIKLPKDMAGKQLSIELKYATLVDKVKIYNLFIGSKASIIYFILSEYGSGFVYFIIFYVISSIFLVMHLFMRKNYILKNAHLINLYFFIFIFFIGLYMFSESKLVQFVIPNSDLSLSLTFLSLYFIPLTYVMYKQSLEEKNDLGLSIFMVVLLFCNILSYCLNYFLAMDFRTLLVLFHILILSIIIYVNIREIKNYFHKKIITDSFISTIVLFVFMLYTMVRYWLTNVFISDSFVVLFAVLFICIESKMIFKYNMELIDTQNKLDFYREMYDKDMMSGLFNRNKYEIDLKNIDAISNSGVIVIDINNLKFINDTLGHKKGDEIIILCSKLIKDIFVDKYKMKAYRTGGDEFIVFFDAEISERILEILNEFEKNISLIRSSNSEFSLSYGYSIYDDKRDFDFATCINRADEKMYKMKKEFHSRIKKENLEN